MGRQLHCMFQCFKSILVFKNIVIIFCMASSRTPLGTLKQRVCSSITLQVIGSLWKAMAAHRIDFARFLPLHSSKRAARVLVLKGLQPKYIKNLDNSQIQSTESRGEKYKVTTYNYFQCFRQAQPASCSVIACT